MGFPLSLVGVECLGGQAAAEDTGQLPTQIHRVTQPCAQSLTDEGRGEMCRVAEQESVPTTPAVRQLGAKGVLRDTDEAELSVCHGSEPWCDEGT